MYRALVVALLLAAGAAATLAAEFEPPPLTRLTVAVPPVDVARPDAGAPSVPPARVPPARVPPASLAPAPPPAVTPEPDVVTIVIGGDLGLNAHAQTVEARGARRHGQFLDWSTLTAGIRPLIDGDLNFANLETVVTARNDLAANDKAFNFRSHPDGVRHLVGLGFNLLSTANNHAIDFGIAGIRDTVANLEAMRSEGHALAHAGVGLDRAAAGRPSHARVRGRTIALSAVGIASGGRAGPDRPGQMSWRAKDDVAGVIDQLAATRADYRILSVHHGQERDVTPARSDIATLRHQGVLEGGVDLVAGHHTHVVQGVEINDGRLIFYGLGNLLHPGMQNMASFGMCRDYGLLARIHLAAEPGASRLRLLAVEAIPLTDMHWTARPMPAERAAQRIAVLNHLAAGLDDAASGARGLRFAPLGDGTGLHCEPGADRAPGRIGVLCRQWSGAPATPSALGARIASACTTGQPVASTSGSRRLVVRSSAGAGSPSSSAWRRSAFDGN